MPKTTKAPARAAGILLAALALAALPAEAAAQQPCGGSYTVRTGDNLTEIAERCATTVPALLALNPALRAGGELEAGGTVRIPPPDFAPPTPFEACGASYTLGPGDALGAVAARCGLTLPLLLAANPGLENPDNVRPGGRVRIPDLPPAGAFEPVIIGVRPTGAGAAPVAAGADSAAAPDPEPFARYEGVLQTRGRCTILRTTDGTEIGLLGTIGGFEAGDRVVVTGPSAEADSACGTRDAIHVRIMWRPRTQE